MAGLIGGGLARALAGARESLNARFDREKGADPSLDPDDALLALAEAAVPVQAAMEAAGRGDRADAWLRPLFDAVLESRRLGSAARTALAGLYPLCVPALDADARRYFGSLLGAWAVASERGAASAWAGLMARALPACGSLDAMRAAGLAAAWLSGMVEYRQAAVAALPAAGDPALGALLGREAFPGAAALAAGRLAADPWLRAAEALDAVPPRASWMGAIGGHEAQGGPFKARPELAAEPRGITVRSGEAVFLLVACAEGLALLPALGEAASASPSPASPREALAGLDLSFQGRASLRLVPPMRAAQDIGKAPGLACAVSGPTAAFVHRDSYLVYVVGSQGGAG